MKPDPRAVLHADGVVARALSDSHGNFAIYLDGNGPSRLTLHLPPGSYTVKWLDPKSGALTADKSPWIVGNRGELAIATPDFENGIALSLTPVYLHN